MTPLNVLVLCTGNSARSILGEALVTHLSGGRARGFSAGSRPGGVVNPVALETLARHGVPFESPRSKSWDEFAGPAATQIDIVITVCDSAGKETCPVWPGAPVQVHWGIADPAHVEPLAARRTAFETAFHILNARFVRFFNAPVETMTPAERKALLRQIAMQIPEAQP
jgi:arsenate reductase